MADKKLITCPDCKGTCDCSNCSGAGQLKKPHPHPDDHNNTTGYSKCRVCEGSGICQDCKGKGKVQE